LNAAHIGDWDVALSTYDAIGGDLGEAGSLGYLTVLRAVAAELLANRGQWTAARRMLDDPQLAVHHSFSAATVSAHAEIELLSGNMDAARTRLDLYLRQHRLPPLVRGPLLAHLADAEVEASNVEAVPDIVAAIDRSDTRVPDNATLARALLCHGRAVGDLGYLREALAIAEEHRHALLQGRALLYLGTAGVDPEQRLTEALEIFHTLGAPPWRRRAAAELRRRGLRIPRHRSGGSPNQLTETEAQIARLVQLGRPNREIARTVVLSVKTVEAYLSRIYAKTGCSSRLELARALDAQTVDL
jgi:DNA-binding CsgD family transcriptional regulator